MKHIKLFEDLDKESINIKLDELRKVLQDLAAECLSSDGNIDSPADAYKWIEKKINELKK
jgi:hypothetical protein